MGLTYRCSDGTFFDDLRMAQEYEIKLVENSALYKLIDESKVFEDDDYYDIRRKLSWLGNKKYLNKKFNIKEIVNNSLNKIRTQKENEQKIKEQQEYIKQLEEKIKMLEIQEQAQEYEVNLELALCDRDYVNFKTLFKIQTMLGAIFQSNITYNRIISKITSKDLNFKINGTNYKYFLEDNKISNLLTSEEKKKVEEFIFEYRLSDWYLTL